MLGPLLWIVAYDKILTDDTLENGQLSCYADDTLLVTVARAILRM